jgi:hypothetical protein
MALNPGDFAAAGEWIERSVVYDMAPCLAVC